MTDTEWTKEYIEHRDRAAREANLNSTPETEHYVDAAFNAGFDACATYERERAKVLIEVLKRCYTNGLSPSDVAHDAMLDNALAKYGEK